MSPNIEGRAAVAGFASLFATLVACTFPSVEYEPACMVPTSCENDVTNCSKQADAQRDMCLSKCTTDCAACETDHGQALSMCVAQCEICSAGSGCENATASCKALLGVP